MSPSQRAVTVVTRTLFPEIQQRSATKNLETYFWHAASLPHGRVTCTECYAGLDAVIGAVWAVNGRQTASALGIPLGHDEQLLEAAAGDACGEGDSL